jgi:isochorismate pyruvate lyase
MREVRQHIDILDQQIVPLLVARTSYMTQAATLKTKREDVYDSHRINTIIQHVSTLANTLGSAPDVIEKAYQALIDASIAFEYKEFDRLKKHR